jgi:hypothetical protein
MTSNTTVIARSDSDAAISACFANRSRLVNRIDCLEQATTLMVYRL